MAATNEGFSSGEHAPYRPQKDSVLHEVFMQDLQKGGAGVGDDQPRPVSKEEEVVANQERDVSLFRSRQSVLSPEAAAGYKMSTLQEMFNKHYEEQKERRKTMWTMLAFLIFTLIVAIVCGTVTLAYGPPNPADDCIAGTYYNNRTTRCDPCGPGEYKEEAGEGQCMQCPDGLITTVVAASSIDACVENCLAGHYYNHDSKMCVECGYGYYQGYRGQGQCMKCPEGLTTYVTTAIHSGQCSNDSQS